MRLTPIPRLAAMLGLCAATLLPALPAHADTASRYNQVSLHAQAQRNVVHDLMRVTLYTESQDSDPARLASAITGELNAATVKARAVAGVTVQSGSRASHPVYGKDSQRIVAWRERAELQLESGDFAALAALTSELMDTLKIASRHFMISPASRKSHEDSLIEEAIAAFRARAQLAAQAFGGKDYRLVSVSLDNAGFRRTGRSAARRWRRRTGVPAIRYCAIAARRAGWARYRNTPPTRRSPRPGRARGRPVRSSAAVDGNVTWAFSPGHEREKELHSIRDGFAFKTESARKTRAG